MSSEINTMSELQRTVLHQLMDGWQTMDEGKTEGMVRLDELADRFGVSVEDMRKEMSLLEAMGYVDNVHSMGMDQTQHYKGFDQSTKREHDPANPMYFITENGKRLVIADSSSDAETEASPD